MPVVEVERRETCREGEYLGRVGGVGLADCEGL